MSLLALLAAATISAPSPSPEVAQEILVIGQKIKSWKGNITKEAGVLGCRTSRSTGDREIDAIRCGAMIACTRPIEGELDRLYNSKALQRKERMRQINAVLQTTLPCLETYNADASRALAEKRAAG